MAKKFLDENNIAYIEKDINKDREAKAEHAKLGVRGVPVFVAGSEIVWGFDKDKLTDMIK